MSTPYREGYRATLAVRTPEGDRVTLIITVRLGHPMGRVWLSFGSTTRTTAAMSNPEVDQLIEKLTEAKAAR